MSDLVAKLSQLTTSIEEVRKAGSTLGLSVGIVHEGQVIYRSHFGRRSSAGSELPDDDTIYYVASLTKAVTAAATAILREQKRLDWDVPVATYLPELAARKDEVGRSATLIDFLSHRTGLSKASALWVQQKQHFMMPKSETLQTVVHLPAAVPFRQSFMYNNWGYGVVEAVLERTAGRSYSELVQDSIFRPLGLNRTMIETPEDLNVASANTNRDDGSICPIARPPQSSETGLAGAGALKTTLSDALCLYQALLSAFTAQENRGLGNDEFPARDNPFRDVRSLFEPRISIGTAELTEHAYALGWVRSTLPRRLGTTSMNALYMGSDELPMIGLHSPGLVVLHHHGNLLGTGSSVHLVPETNTAIVVLTNTLGFSDTADWVGQLVLQTVIGERPHDYVDWTRRSRRALFKQYEELSKSLERGRRTETSPLDLNIFCGRYVNAAGNFTLDISLQSGALGLQMVVQNMEDVMYNLSHHAGTTFYWPCDREREMCDLVMFPWTWEGVHKIGFDFDSDGSVVSLSWGLDPTVAPHVFIRRPGTEYRCI